MSNIVVHSAITEAHQVLGKMLVDRIIKALRKDFSIEQYEAIRGKSSYQWNAERMILEVDPNTRIRIYFETNPEPVIVQPEEEEVSEVPF